MKNVILLPLFCLLACTNQNQSKEPIRKDESIIEVSKDQTTHVNKVTSLMHDVNNSLNELQKEERNQKLLRYINSYFDDSVKSINNWIGYIDVLTMYDGDGTLAIKNNVNETFFTFFDVGSPVYDSVINIKTDSTTKAYVQFSVDTMKFFRKHEGDFEIGGVIKNVHYLYSK